MSHSSLSAQLASLHSKNTTSSRKQSDAIGRGIHHSSNAGHSVLYKSSTKHKPSVIHADSRAAAIADIPFTTLRENAVISLQYLSQHCSPLFDMSGSNLPWQTLYGSKSIKFERGLNTADTNAKFDGMIKDALFLLSSAWGDAASSMSLSSITKVQLGGNVPSSVLHALEYLVQKYYVHVHNAENLLVAFLPHHETFLFDRLIQLMDLAQMPQWAFLRPYSATVGVSGVPRTMIAKWAASTKDNGGGIVIIKRVCELAKRGAKIHSLEIDLGFHADMRDVRRGVSIFISFAAAIVAEALHIQYSSVGSIEESTLRCLVPFILGAVEPSNSKRQVWSLGALCPEWRTFGQIAASLLVGKCDLSEELCEAFSTGIIRGAFESIKLIRSQSEDEEMEENDNHNVSSSSSSMQSIVDVSANAILSMILLVLNNKPRDESVEDDGIQRYLPKINAQQDGCFGCKLPSSSFKSLMKLPYLPVTLGYLSEVKDMEIKHLISTIIAMRISSSANSTTANKDEIQILVDLIEEPSLRNVWVPSENSLTAPATAFIIETVKNLEDTTFLTQSLGVLLKSLKTVNSTDCDIGVAFSVKKVSSLEDKNEKTTSLKSVRTLLEAAGFIDEYQSKSDRGQEENLMDTIDDFDLMLPASVALEHSSQHLRLSAVSKLILDANRDGVTDKVIVPLVRRYVSDDDTSVASAAAEALITIILNDPSSEIVFLQKEVIQDIAFGLKKWIELGDEKMLCLATKLSGIVCRFVKEKMAGFLNEDRDQNREVTIHHYDSMIQDMVKVIESCDMNSSLATFVKEAIHNAAGNGAVEDSMSLLIENVVLGEMFQMMMRRFIDGISNDVDLNQEHLLWFFLRKFMKSSGDKFSGDGPMLVLDACVLLLERYNENFVKTDSFMEDASSLCETLGTCISYLLSSGNVEELVILVADLCTVKSNVAYEEISRNVLTSVNATGPSLYPYILLEVLSRQDLASQGVERILPIIQSTGSSMGAKDRKSFMRFMVICVVALCSRTDLGVRQYAIDFLRNLTEQVKPGVKTNESEFSSILSLLSSSESSLRSSLLMDGLGALPKLLSTAIYRSDKRDNLRKLILTTCAELVTKHLMLDKAMFGKGICNSIAILMEAMECAGEKAFPLSERWSLAGKQMFSYFIEMSSSPNLFPDEMQGLFECTIVMLKGVTIEDTNMEDSVVIVTGPASSGRRRRSYSIGCTNWIGQIEPYPNTMSSCIVKFLEATIKNVGDKVVYRLCDSLNRLVLGRQSWCNGIFPKLKESIQTSIINLLLTLRSDNAIESSGLVLLGLPWTTSQVIDAMRSKSSRASNTDAGGLLALTTILECIRSHASRLGNESGFELPNAMFEKLSTLSKIKMFTEGTDYARTCIINSLLSLLQSRGSQDLDTGRKFTKDITLHSQLLVTLLGQGNEVIKPLISGRSKSLCLQLLTQLCSLSPTLVTESLIPVLTCSISDEDDVQVTKDAMMSLIPTYCKYAPKMGYCLLDLLNAVSERVNGLSDVTREYHVQLYKQLITALLSCMSPQGGSNAVAIVLTSYVSNEAFKGKMKPLDSNDSSLTFISELLALLNTDTSLNATLPALKCIGSLIRFSQDGIDSQTSEEKDFLSFEPKAVYSIITNGPSKESIADLTQEQMDKSSVLWTIMTMIHAIKNVFLIQSVRRTIRTSDDERAKICLQIWQELMLLQSFTAHIRFDEAKGKGSGRKYFDLITDEISTALLELQNLLPIPHFLAAVTSLIQDTEVEVEIQRRAILLLAERASEINNLSHEAVLFLEMVPDLVNLADVNIDFDKDLGDFRRSAILTQCAFKAIDQLLKCFVLSLSDEKIIRSRSKVFIPAQKAVSECLSMVSNGFNYQKFLAEDEMAVFNLKVQIISSAALCAASLVTLMKARCLAVLSRLVNPLVAFLASANDAKKAANGQDVDDGSRQAITLVQLSVLRALVAVAEHIPQFFMPYLDKLLTPQGLPSLYLRDGFTEEEIAISNMADRLDIAISKGIPIRQLAPVLSKATSRFLRQNDTLKNSWRESLVIFKILKLSIENASRADIGPLAGKIISSLVQAYSFDCDAITRHELMDTANSTLLAMVMKLSEAQLRPLYARLREWRGDINTSASDTVAARRRNAFWSFSAAMSKELRSIFLPCMSSVVSDVVKELELAASCLAASKSSIKGQKRQKLETPPSDISYSAISLQSLLLCLELSLKADAHEGGNWIRGDEGQRYSQILQPLTQLLSANVPPNFEILPLILLDGSKKSFTHYERLVQGETTEDYGNVIDCLTALAAAAGNEQMWKPLNHALLEACGNEKRPEVRKSGVKALLSIIHTLGEEYMVLLPECLPVLSELLEDDDEDVVALAKECVQQGEELLGESLEDSLR